MNRIFGPLQLLHFKENLHMKNSNTPSNRQFSKTHAVLESAAARNPVLETMMANMILTSLQKEQAQPAVVFINKRDMRPNCLADIDAYALLHLHTCEHTYFFTIKFGESRYLHIIQQ